MGIIADRLAGETRSAADWLVNDDTGDSGRMSPAGVRVGRSEALGLSTYWRCVDLISHAVSLAPVSMVVKVGGQSFPEHRDVPGWMSAPNPSDPNYSLADHFGECALSMLVEGNYFTSALPSVWEPLVLTVHDPSRVRVVPGPLYEILDASGRAERALGPDQMLHGWWMRLPGQLRGISPLEYHRRGLGSAIAADEFGGRYFGQGATLSFGVEIPGEMTADQKSDLRSSLKREHTGIGNAHAIGILTRGGKFVKDLAPTPEQSQMLATRKYGVEDVARIFGVPPGMAGSQEPGASSYASAIEWRRQFRDDAVLKFTDKLERSYGRLLSVPAAVADPSATVQLKFNLDWIARTDLLARYQAHGEGVRGGFLMPNEARALEDMPPVKEGGDMLYMQSQMAPISMLGMAPPAPAPQMTRSEIEDAVRAAMPEPVTPEAVRAEPEDRPSLMRTVIDYGADGKPCGYRTEPVPIRTVMERDAAGRPVSITEVPA